MIKIFVFLTTTLLLQISNSQEVKIPLSLHKGWNLFSVPVTPCNCDIENFFHGKNIGSLWTFNSRRLETAERIEIGKAYWIYLTNNIEIVYNGKKSISSQRMYDEGWSLYGIQAPISIPTETSHVMWRYLNGSFRVVSKNEKLHPSKGYWINLMTATSLPLGSLDTDTDSDDIPDYWEALWGQNYNDSMDQNFDEDQDGLGALSEYLARTNPLYADTIQPSVIITEPESAEQVIEGQKLTLTADATDDERIAQVMFLVNGADIGFDSTFPFKLDFTVPTNIAEIEFTAIAQDANGNVGNSQLVKVNVISDPFTTVIGSLINENGGPVGGAEVVTNGNISGVTLADGSFTLINVPTILGDISVMTTLDSGGTISKAILPVRGGITDVGEISIRKRFFYPGLLFAVGDRPESVVIEDLNNDGNLDIVTTNQDSNNVSVLLGKGNGTFLAQLNFATGLRPGFLAIGDLNNDENPDILTITLFGSSILLGNGDGTFQGPVGFGAGPRSVAIGDLNNDGNPDLVVTNSSFGSIRNDVSVLLGNGDGTFQGQQGLDTGSDPNSLAIGDLNGDGNPDIATVNRSFNDVSLLLGNGDGTFQGQLRFDAGSDPAFIAIGDLNNNGNLDLIVTSFSTEVSILLGNGDGTFQGQLRFDTGSDPVPVAISDLNNDGNLDIVTSRFSVLLGNGDGTFHVQQIFDITPVHGQAVAIGDLDNDGIPDMVTAYRDTDNVSVILGNGDGTFQVPSRIEAGGVPNFAAINDLNNDGTQDLVTTNSGSNKVSIFLGNSDGTFQDPRLFSTGDGPNSVAIADLNKDGIPDLATANSRFGHDVSVLLGNGDGTFQIEQRFDMTFFPRSIAVGDVNNDQNQDILTTSVISGFTSDVYYISVLLGNGDGTFQTQQRIEVSRPELFYLAMSDLNNDGYPDIATASGGTGTGCIEVFLGNCAGSFQVLPRFCIGDTPTFLTIENLNNDGYLDIVTANRMHDSISVLLGNGDGTFTEPLTLGTGDAPRTIATSDLDNDGKPDLITVNDLSYDISVFWGIGDGTFEEQQQFIIGPNPRMVATEDLNNDGIPDIVTAHGSNISVLLTPP